MSAVTAPKRTLRDQFIKQKSNAGVLICQEEVESELVPEGLQVLKIKLRVKTKHAYVTLRDFIAKLRLRRWCTLLPPERAIQLGWPPRVLFLTGALASPALPCQMK